MILFLPSFEMAISFMPKLGNWARYGDVVIGLKVLNFAGEFATFRKICTLSVDFHKEVKFIHLVNRRDGCELPFNIFGIGSSMA
jgi:hypothetical protein